MKAFQPNMINNKITNTKKNTILGLFIDNANKMKSLASTLFPPPFMLTIYKLELFVVGDRGIIFFESVTKEETDEIYNNPNLQINVIWEKIEKKYFHVK